MPNVTNIPTDLLRTLVAVVDMSSFTKAAAALGVSQPAVSAQIKRLQYSLGTDLLDRGAQGVRLTPQGELVMSYARRMLSINDQIVHLAGTAARPELVIRIGTPSDYVASLLPGMLSRLRDKWPDVRFVMRSGCTDPLMRDLRAGELDLFIGLSPTVPHDARFTASEEVVWVRGPATRFDPNRPVPLVTYGESNVYRRLAAATLKAAGFDCEDVFTGPSIASLQGALKAGLGVMPITRRRALDHGLSIWEDTPLPKLPDLYCGIYIREGGASAAYAQLADEIAASIYGPLEVRLGKANTAA